MDTTTSSKRLRTGAGLVSALSLLPHIFCCLLPTVAALLALGSTVGLGTALMGNPLYRFVDAWHPWLLALAVFSVALAALSNFIAWRVDCHTPTTLNHHHGCDHGACAPKKRTSLKLLYISMALLAIDVAWYAAETHLLHLHNHGHEAEEHHDHAH